MFPETFDPKTITIPHLVTIPYSHYCEIARWALEHANTDFKEIKYAPGTHSYYIGRLRADHAHRSETSFVGQESGTHGGRRKYAVPLLCMPDGELLRDSWEILAHALGPADPHWAQRLDNELGICVRQIIYHAILTPTGMPILRNMLADSALIERALWVFMGGKLQTIMRRMMAITPENVEAAKVKVLSLLEDVSQTLHERGGSIASETGFGSTELAFSALAAVCVIPDNYSNGVISLPALKVFPQDFQDFVATCRSTQAGQFALDAYAQQRSTD